MKKRKRLSSDRGEVRGGQGDTIEKQLIRNRFRIKIQKDLLN